MMGSPPKPNCDHSEGVMVRGRVMHCGQCGHRRDTPQTWFVSSSSIPVGTCRPMFCVGNEAMFMDDTGITINFDFTQAAIQFERAQSRTEELSRSITAMMKAEFLAAERVATSFITNVTS